VVDEDVELAKAGHGFGDSRLPIALAGDVELPETRLPSGGGDGLRHLPAFVLEEVADHDPRALASEDRRLALPHAACPSRDEGHLARESHVILLVSSRARESRPLRRIRDFRCGPCSLRSRGARRTT